ncbi:hypothetical protein JWG39_02845 [Desulforhopalus vacuolatus]|uniref:hypothetical protein n=1 Tax=Desulforhopalus vacuolatus TaxID=40414 RepID=UPI0019652BFF|nr:hypothetical protein [Desulforhopalus vacuolatus]MBM9518756.1 hypothetical protein [Desulforhopalus vacuolatus]
MDSDKHELLLIRHRQKKMSTQLRSLVNTKWKWYYKKTKTPENDRVVFRGFAFFN